MSEFSSKTATLLVTCPDSVGIVAALSQVLSTLGANILDADQHTDEICHQFFQRIRFDMTGVSVERTDVEAAVQAVAARYQMTWRIAWGDQRKRVALFVSQHLHCLVDLLWRHKAGELDCDIPLIVSNHDDARPIAEQFGIRFEKLEITKDNKAQQEARQIEWLREVKADLVVMARYMQVLTSNFIDAMNGQVINIHHSFLPAFMGGRPYHRAAERGVKLIGATAHYATSNLDEGPIIEQDVTRCTHRDRVDDLIRKGRDLERTVLASALRWHLEDRVLVCGSRTVIFE